MGYERHGVLRAYRSCCVAVWLDCEVTTTAGPLPAPRQMTPLRRRAPEAARSFRFGRALPADAAIYPEKLEGPVLQLKMRL